MITREARNDSLTKPGYSPKSDRGSDEYILSPTGTSVSGPSSLLGYGGKQDINKTTQVSVAYNARDVDEESDVGFTRYGNEGARTRPQEAELYGTQLAPYPGQPQGMYPPHVLKEQQENPSELPSSWKR